MAALLEAVQLDRLAQQRIWDAFGIGADIHARLVLGLHRDVPDRQAGDALFGFRIQLGPVQHRRAIGIEGVEQRLAEQALVFVRAEADRTVARPGAGIAGKVGRNGENVRAHLGP